MKHYNHRFYSFTFRTLHDLSLAKKWLRVTKKFSFKPLRIVKGEDL